MRTSSIKRYVLMKHFRDGIFVKSNTKRFTEITNCNLFRRLVELTLLSFNDVEEHDHTSDGGLDFLVWATVFDKDHIYALLT